MPASGKFVIYRDTDGSGKTGASATPATKEPSAERKGTPASAPAQGAASPIAQLSVDKDGRAQIVFCPGKPASSCNNGSHSSKTNHSKRAGSGHSGSTGKRGPLSPKKSAINRIPGLAGVTGSRDSLKNHILPPPPRTFTVPHILKRKPDANSTRNGKSNSISKAMPTATAVRSGLGINNSVKAPLETKPTKPINSKMPLPAAEAALAAIINRRRNRIPLAAAPVSTSTAADVIPARPDSIATSPPSTANVVADASSQVAGPRLPPAPSQLPPKRKPSLALALAQATRKRPHTRRLQQKRREQRRLERGTSDVSSSASSSSSSSDERRDQNKNGFEEEDDEELNLDDESSDSEEGQEGQEGQEGIIEGLLALREGNWR